MTPYEAMLAAEALKGKGAPLMSPANPYSTSPFTPTPAVDPRYGLANQELSGQDRDIENQRMQALALQRQSMESPGIIRAGDVAVAGASPLTALAQGLMGYQSGKMNRKADEASGALSKTRAAQAQAAGELAAEEAAKKAAAAEKKAILEQQKADDANTRAEATRANALKIAQLNQGAADARNAADNIAAMERAKIAAETKAKSGDEIDPVSKRRLKQEESVFGRLNSVLNDARVLQSKGGEIGKPSVDYLAEKAKDFPFGGETVANLISQKGYTPEELAIRGRMDNAVEQYRRAFTGANLTLLERLLGTNWDPTVAGVSTPEKITRTENLMEVLNTNRDAFGLPPLEATDKSAPATETPTTGNPAGVDDAVWNAMTPEEQALFQ